MRASAGSSQPRARQWRNCHIRPRYPGYMAMQAKAGPLIERHLRGEHDETAVLTGLGII